MPLDEPFPLHLFSAQIRTAILNEFNGRCPGQREVAEIPDTRWLSTPAIGPIVLKKIRALGSDEALPTPHMTDAELLGRLTVLQGELKLLQRTVRMWTPRISTEAAVDRRSPSSRTLSLLHLE